MNKLKIFTFAAVLSLVTAGVLANKVKLAPSDIYYYSAVTSGTLEHLSGVVTTNTDFNTTAPTGASQQAQLQNCISPIHTYPLYTSTGTAVYVPF